MFSVVRGRRKQGSGEGYIMRSLWSVLLTKYYLRDKLKKLGAPGIWHVWVREYGRTTFGTYG